MHLQREGNIMSSGGMLGGGGFFGNEMSPRGPYGAWPGCGCSSIIIIIAGILLVCGGGLKMLNM
jgi:hypothetical protein